MAVEFEGAFVTVDELKDRLGIGDTEHDSELEILVKNTSGAMEAYVGRDLRRSHYVEETFNGGKSIIWVSTPPIAKIHWIRESRDRDFDTAANYTELVEGDDYVLLGRGQAGRPGEGGGIQRIGCKWMGGQKQPGQVRVAYTGGYKTDQEIAIENASITISGESANDAGIRVFSVFEVLSGTFHSTTRIIPGLSELPAEGVLGEEDSVYVICSVRLCDQVLPVWSFRSFVCYLYGYETKDVDPALEFYLLDQDPLISSAQELYESVEDASVALGTGAVVTSDGSYPQPDINLSLLQVDGISDTQKTALSNNIKLGHISFAVVIEDDPSAKVYVAGNAFSNPKPANFRPSCEIVTSPSFGDPFNVPSDLREACLMQAIHTWQTRKHPGLTTASQRGVTIASGAAFQKFPLALLPFVKTILDRYKLVT